MKGENRVVLWHSQAFYSGIGQSARGQMAWVAWTSTLNLLLGIVELEVIEQEPDIALRPVEPVESSWAWWREGKAINSRRTLTNNYGERCSRHCSQNSFDSHHIWGRRISVPLYRWGNCHIERQSHLLKVNSESVGNLPFCWGGFIASFLPSLEDQTRLPSCIPGS